MKLSRSLMPELSALQAFEAAARHGSFTRAAEELNLTQSAVSRQIRDLEAQLGVALFERVRQRVVLSSTGQRLRPEAERILSGIAHLALNAAGSRDVTGHLTIATLPTFGSRWLMPRLPAFLAAHPGLQATVLSRDGHFDLEDAGVDLAVHHGRPAWPGAGCTHLCAETVIAVATPDLAGPDRELSDTTPLLHLEARSAHWSQWLGANGRDPARGFQGHRFDQFALTIEAALAGLGAALLPAYLIEREMAQGLLVPFRGACPPPETDTAYYIVVPDGRASEPIVQAFVGWIRAQVRRDPDGPAGEPGALA